MAGREEGDDSYSLCLVYCSTANGVAWSWHTEWLPISGRRFPIHLTRRSSHQPGKSYNTGTGLG